jgi:2,4-diketo-3-deoxy-L-fuconate hydrolase
MRIANLDGRLTLLAGDGGIDVEDASGGAFSADPQEIFQRWEEFRQWAAGQERGRSQPVARERLGPPAPRPRQVFAIGLNYRDHAAESGIALPDDPTVFTKYVSSFTGPTGAIVLPSAAVDWEVELVAVVGKQARQVSEQDGWAHVAGLTIGQDLSERDVQVAGAKQFSIAKSFPGFSPTGPWLVTPDEFDDPDDLVLGCSIDGAEVQKGRTSDMVFPVPSLVSRLSEIVTLYPGDVIFTGTPAGVGIGRTPQRFLVPGEELVTFVEGIGEMRHSLVARD